MGALLAECLLPREKLNTTREMEEERERGGEQGGSQSHEERKARIEERSQTDMRALYSSCLFFCACCCTVCSAIYGSAESPVLTAAVIHWGSFRGPND